jgi:cellobiose phosphorylase
MKYEVARKQFSDVVLMLKQQFPDVELTGECSAVLVSAKHKNVAGVCGLDFYVPVMDKLVVLFESVEALRDIMNEGCSILVKWCAECEKIEVYKSCGGKTEKVEIEGSVAAEIIDMIKAAHSWGGKINENGELIADLTSPIPGPHYYTNLLIGNRIGFEKPLQSTPKSVVDRLGRGSFRSHADTQVLATRWDYLPTENGFPANRQFYLIENGKVIFYSANPSDKSVVDGKCIHSQNNTVITYTLDCGLEIKRTIFILPQVKGLPIASEAQIIEVTNTTDTDRDIKLVYTGMFGTSSTDALKGDVIYTTVIMESNVLYNDNDDIIGVSYHYNPEWEQGNVRFHTMVMHDGDKTYYPDEYCFNYTDFIGEGTLEYPTGAAHLNNRHNRKGPGFFAVGADMHIKAGATVQSDNITSLTSDVVNPDYVPVETFKAEAEATAKYFEDKNALPKLLERVKSFSEKYTSFLSIEDEDKNFETYVNKSLPFQVYYQTFVSRSFDQTQKGYREIGFREIQDIYASMYYWVGMGEKEVVKSFLCEWAANVFEFGFANHNYYWKGKEPGLCSDDQLWLVQALERYVSLTKDYDFLNTEVPMADGGKRKLIDTVKALIIYSSKISVGKHGLPAIDSADWNDCLHVDNDCIDGHEKQRRYEEQIAKGGKFGDRFESEYSESVMNGFLLKVAVDAAARFYKELGDSENEKYMEDLSKNLYDNLQKNCWKGDFFARVLFNRSELPNIKYLGAGGDGFSIEEGKPGAYYLNSFGWSILAGVATDEQIEIMLDSADKYLKTPYGYRLCTGANYGLVADRVAVALYFIGDRENGGIFKHANMMFAGALVKAANEVKDKKLAKRITDTVYWLISVIAPYVTMDSPFTTCGNPRFCTQYNNSDTGENIGPTLSGTSTWLLLTIMNMLGIHYKEGAISYLPIPKEEQKSQTIHLNIDNTKYNITVTKPEGFYRATDCDYTFKIDGEVKENSTIPLFADGKEHKVEFIYK